MQIAAARVVLIFIYIVVSFYWPQCVVCLFVCVIPNQITSKKNMSPMSDLSRLDALRHKTLKGEKVGCRVVCVCVCLCLKRGVGKINIY